MASREKVQVAVLRVFTGRIGRFGNELGIVEARSDLTSQSRQQLATQLGFSETVFIDDVSNASVQLFTPATELPFAGHPLVGVAWFLARKGSRLPTVLRPPGGEVSAWIEDDRVWVRGPLRFTPPWWHERLESPDVVGQMTGPYDESQDATQFWAWLDEAEGIARARVFAARYGVHEDEACGSASMRLAAALGRELLIHHGHGSLVWARPAADGTACVGGLVSFDRALECEVSKS